MSEALPPPTTLGALVAGCTDARFFGCDARTAVCGATSDSRRVAPGMLFVALKGGAHDGHAFVDDALAKGAAAVLVNDDAKAPSGAHIRVADTWRALPSVAAAAWGDPAAQMRLVGVTGTNGKTTTAHLVGAIFRAASRLHARLGTTGNWLVDREDHAGFTTPFPIELQALVATARARGATDLVMEVSSHALAQARVAPLRYHAVGLTSFSQDHLDFHRDMDDYLAAKCLLASTYLREDGVAVAASDDQPASERFLDAARGAGARTWRASRGQVQHAEIAACEIEYAATHTRARVDTPLGPIALVTPLVGPFNLDNVLVAIGLALGVGIDGETIAAGLATTRGAPGRLESVAVDGVAGPVVLVDYAHTPDAVERTLAVLRPLAKGKLVVLLGCGGDRDPTKRPLMGGIAARDADVFWATSDNPRTEPPEAIVAQMVAGTKGAKAEVIVEVDRAKAIAGAIATAADDDIVLLAGKGHEDYQQIGTTKIHFDDREHAREALLRRR
jgi:UDP-N-acetylmuramoyl-L-alanyl-D-glutamate--2,6-diaminopimelate ligase